MWTEDFLTYLEAELNRSPLTIEVYRNSLKQFREFLDEKAEQLAWDEVDEDVVRDWMVELMERGENARTVCKKLSALKTFYRFLLQRGWVKRDPVHNLQGPKKEKLLPTFVREQEMDELLDGQYFSDDLQGQRDRLILLTLYSTGIRRAEMVGLNWKDVDFSLKQLKVTGKRNKQRIVPFGTEMEQALNQYRQLLKTEEERLGSLPAVFRSVRTGKRITSQQIYEVVKKYLSLVTTLKKKSPHVLRHSFATAMLNHEADLQSVKDLLGHVNLATTEIYTHTTFEELKRMYNQAHPRAK